MSSADLRSLGVSEAQYTEHDDYVAPVDGEVPDGLSGTFTATARGRWEDHTGRPRTICSTATDDPARSIDNGAVRYRNRYVRTRHYRGKGGRGTSAPTPRG